MNGSATGGDTRWRDGLVAAALFSAFYWLAAVHKGYHVDEFYSWVYTLRFSAGEILRMADTGIGHPPLFHLLLKASQTLFGDAMPVALRAVNFVVGLATIPVMMAVLRQHRYRSWFLWALVISGSWLNGLVFARMYGLMLLAGFLTVWRGEAWIRSGRPVDLLWLLATVAFGMVADFNYAILLPYAGYAALYPTRLLKGVIAAFLALIIPLWLFLGVQYGEISGQGDLAWSLYKLVRNGFSTVQVSVFNILPFWFHETLVTAVVAVAGATAWGWRRARWRGEGLRSPLAGILLLAVVVLTLSRSVLRTDLVPGRVAVLPGLAVVVLLMWALWRWRGQVRLADLDTRLLLSLLGAFLIVLTMTSIFWRPLVGWRFVLVLFPLVTVLVLRNLPEAALRLLAALMALSGVLFAGSASLDSIYPAGRSADRPVVFQNTHTVATHYLTTPPERVAPLYFLDMGFFEASCRICTMGTTAVPFAEWDAFTLVGYREYAQEHPPPSGFELVTREEVPLSALDRWQFRWLTPVHDRDYAVFHYRRATP